MGVSISVLSMPSYRLLFAEYDILYMANAVSIALRYTPSNAEERSYIIRCI